MKENKIYYSEIFGNTIQGEGQYTGVPTVWIRFFLCNLECAGFGQDTPSKPETYKSLESKLIDLVNITDIKDLPVFEYGCDSAYSVAKRYKHLQKHETVSEIVDRIQALLPDGKFFHPVTKQPIHFAFTGGEPMINQDAIVQILEEFSKRDMKLKYVTFESNGTKPIKQNLVDCLVQKIDMESLEVLWSVSPKLLHTAGEQRKKAIKPENFSDYYHELINWCKWSGRWSSANDSFYDLIKMQIKFVANGTEETWNEINEVVALCNEYDLKYRRDKITFWIMPVGGTLEGQEGKIEGHIGAGQIADEAIKRGFNVAARVHNYLWSNVVGK